MNNDVIKVQLSCGVDYYKGEKGDKPVKGVDYFTQEDIAEIVEQIETGGIDLTDYATKDYVDSAVSGVVVSETDPTVPQWAKQPNKPSYTASEVGALPADTQLFSGNYNDLSNKPAIPTVPANVSAFNNDAGYLTEHQSLTDYATKAYVDDAIADIPAGGITVETDPTVPSWAKQPSKPTYTAQEVGALPANTELFSGDYEDLTNKPTLAPTPIVIQATIAGQPTVDSNGNYTLPLAITSNNMAEAYAQYQTHPSTVGISVDLSAMGMRTKMYMDCESFYRNDDNNGGYVYLTFGEFNDSSFSYQFGFDFQNINVRLSTFNANDSYGTVIGVATVHQLASKANSADLATVATSGDYNDLSNKPTIPTAYTLPTATTSTLGGVKVDGSTITIDGNGVISSSGGSSYTFTNGLTESNGTVSWDLNSRIKVGTGINSLRLNTSNTVNGDQSLAEGFHTSANGAYSHAEGNYTQASGNSQHAEGKYNVEDSNSVLQNIAGNGTASTRATMFARDWNGNEYLSGNLYVGCNDFTTTANGLTTANAGGNKVATESYVATAIANIPSGGGTTYSAGNGISISNNTISADTTVLATKAEIPAVSITETDGDDYGTLTIGNKSISIGNGLMIEADPDTGDGMLQCSLEVPTVGNVEIYTTEDGYAETRKIIDGIGIGAGLDVVEGTDPYALPEDEEGTNGYWLVATGNSSGSSYTAGNGINIDSNNEISALPQPSLGLLIVNNMMPMYNPYVKRTSANTTWEEFIKMLRQGQVVQVYNSPSWASGYQYELNASTFLGDASANLYYCDLATTNEVNNFMTGSVYPRNENTFYYDGTVLYKLYGALGWSRQIKVQLSGQQQLKSLLTVLDDFNTRIPTAPTTDGNYVLKVSVSSGTPTYSWVAET